MNSFFQMIWIIFSSALILLAIYQWIKYYYARNHWIDVKGTVVDIKEQYSNNTSVTYFPIFKYTIAEGQEITQAAQMGSSFKVYNIGEELEIFYNPDKNTEYEIKGKEAIMIPLAIFVAGTVFLLIGLFVIKG